MSYELHTLPDGSKQVFFRGENRYVTLSDPGYLAWKNETRLLFTTELQDQEIPVYDEEGNQIGTEIIQVPVQVPVMVEVPVYDEFGEQTGIELVQATELVHPETRTIPLAAFVGTYDLPSPPSLEERVTAIEDVIVEVFNS